MSHLRQTGEKAARGMLRVGDLARQSGKTVRAIHLYEELGLLKPASRSSGGFRLYEPNAVERVRWIDLLHGMGFSLHEMKDVLQGWWRSELGPEAMDRLRALFQAKLAENRRAVERHRQIEIELEAGLAYLETCKVCPTHESVNGCVRCPQDHGMEGEPALVAGLMSEPGPSGRAKRPAPAAFVRVDDIGRRVE
jgi:MerR family copper efflux transcriptional regulator